MIKVLHTLFIIFRAIPLFAEGTGGDFGRYELETQEMLEALSNPENWPICAYKNYRLGKRITTETQRPRWISSTITRGKHREKNNKGQEEKNNWFETFYSLSETTYVEGYITENTTWDTAGSPYVITNDVFVDSCCTLTIEPGVAVIFEREYSYLYSIVVHGRLFAIGTETDTITFTYKEPARFPSEPQWGSIWFRDSIDTTSRIEYCKLVYGYRMILCDTGSPLILNNSFYWNPLYDYPGGSCIYVKDSKSYIRGNYLTGWRVGISGQETSHFTVEENIFDSLTDGVVLLDSTSCIIRRNLFSKCNTAIFCTGDSSREILITHNVIKDGLYEPGIYINHCASLVKIYNNTIVDNGSEGIVVLYEESRAEITGNIISWNGGRGGICAGSYNIYSLDFNCLFENTQNFEIFDVHPESIGLGVLTETNYNGDSCDSFFNIFLDPLFYDSTDFNLLEDSPCIDAGDPTFPLDPDSTIADIGAFPFGHTPWVPETRIKKPDRCGISCYPNPFNANLQIEISGVRAFHETPLWVEIFDIKGKLVGGDNQLTAYCLLPAKFTWQPDRSLPSGIYLVRVKAGNLTATKRVVYLK
ncbi:right-handed parallel beta-helix repeat-containing protein [bacterium]|nr:right-handed parallel beta-helix repeat-containing protein [bacterium]